MGKVPVEQNRIVAPSCRRYLYVLLVLLKVSQYKKGAETEEMKRYIAWQLEQQQPGTQIVFIFDFTDAGAGKMVSECSIRYALMIKNVMIKILHEKHPVPETFISWVKLSMVRVSSGKSFSMYSFRVCR